MKSIILTALDIGTHSIKGLCARKDLKTGEIEILAKAQSDSFGMRNGEPVKPNQVSQSILKVKNELSRQANIKIKKTLVNISGPHLFSLVSEGVVSVSRADQKISREDVQRVLRQAEAVNLPLNKEVLNNFPREFIIDGEGGVKSPIGLRGMKLQVKVLLVCFFPPVLENLTEALDKANLQVLDEVLDAIPSVLASARACLTSQQKELGVMLVDIGAGTTSMAIFEKGDLIDFAVFPIGSSNITNDIAIGLRAEISTAEKIKKEFGSLKLKNKKKKNEKVVIPESSLSFSRKFLDDIVIDRVSEIFSELQKRIKKNVRENQLPAGIVLTGGGALLPGIVDFARQQLKLPARIKQIKAISGIDDIQFACCYGILLAGFDAEEKGDSGEINIGKGIRGILRRIFKAFLP